MPSLEVESHAITIDWEGGEFEFGVTVKNSDEAGRISCAASESWIEDLDCSEDGVVSFSVGENSGDDWRSGEIVFVYEYPYGVLEEVVTVVQDYFLDALDYGELRDVIGTYSASGVGYDSSFTSVGQQQWTLKIYMYTGDDDYDIYIDGLTPNYAGYYARYLSHMCSAGAYYRDGKIVVPSQIIPGTTRQGSDGSTSYFGWIACTRYDGSSFYLDDDNWPDVVFTYEESSGSWLGDYGSFAGVFSDPEDLSSIRSYDDATAPGTVITRTTIKTNSVSTQVATSFEEMKALTDFVNGHGLQ